MPHLAIVISAVGCIESLEGTLLSVLENRPRDCEIIVSQNQAYADPYDLKGDVSFVETDGRVAPVARIRRALAETRAPFVHLLASGCQVGEGWAEAALSRFGDRRVGSVVPMVVEAGNHDCIFAAGVGYRRGGARWLVGRGQSQLSAQAHSEILGPCGFAGFYRKSALDFVGGPSSQLGLRQADVDLALVLKRAGFTAAMEPRSRVYATGEVERNESPFTQALQNERLFWRNLSADGRLQALAAHAGLVTVEFLCSLGRPRMLTQLTARALACGQIGGYLRHHYALAQLKRRALGPQAAHQIVRVDRSHTAGADLETKAARAQLR